MTVRTFKPSPKYLTKLRLTMTIVAILVLAFGVLLGWLISLDEKAGAESFKITLIVTAALDLIWWIPGLLLSGPYYQSLSYEIQDDEVIVRAGIITQAVKHVPYRTVTNLTIKRGILDRWLFDLGTLNIQTAGMSGNTGAEESLAGLSDYDAVYNLVATELRRFRGAMAPTAAGQEDAPISLKPDALNAILSEVRAIRQAVEKNA